MARRRRGKGWAPNGAANHRRKLFNRDVMARDGALCIWRHRRGHTCDGRIDVHHIVKAQTIRNSIPKGKQGRWAIVYHPDNGIVVCRAGHARLTDKLGEFGHLRAQDVPKRALDFAQEHGFESALIREVPELAPLLREESTH